MNLSSLNPFKKKTAEPFVWAKVDPMKPFRGLDQFSDKPKAPFFPAVKVLGIDMGGAKLELTGKVPDYKKIPRSKLFELTEGDLTITMKLDELKAIFR